MEINWFTVIAQIVNFLILVWLLKRFLYRPVLRAIEDREKKIAAQLGEASAKKLSAQEEHDMFQRKNEAFEKDRATKMNQVLEEANSEKQRLFKEVRNESNALRLKYEESLKQQERQMTNTLKRKTKNEVFAIAGKTLSDLANANLEEQAVNVLITKIKGLDGEDKAKLKNAFDHNDLTITIKSAFELSSSSKSELEKAIEGITGRHNNFRYVLDQELISGIEIDTKSYQLSWNIESYLEALKNNITTKEKENATL